MQPQGRSRNFGAGSERHTSVKSATLRISAIAALTIGVVACSSSQTTPPQPTPTEVIPVSERSLAVNARLWLARHPLTSVRVCVGQRCQILGSGAHHRLLAKFRLPSGPPIPPGPLVSVTISREGQAKRHREMHLDIQPTTSLHPCHHPIIFDVLTWVTGSGRLHTDYLPRDCAFPH